MSSNPILKVSGLEEERLRMALSLGWTHKEATGYRVDDEKGLIFYWTPSERATPFPHGLSCDVAATLAWEWLHTAAYPPEPDIDGHCEGGWLVYCETWGYIDHEWEAMVAVKPHWMEYGK